MILSKSCEYGIRAVLYLVSLGQNSHVSIRTLSDDLTISFHFLTKIFQKMTEVGLLHSLKGPHGGVRLAKPAASISLRDLVVAIDGDRIFTQCVLGLPSCDRAHPCPLHPQWGPQRAQIETMFGATSLADLAADINRLGLRLSSAPGENS